MYVAGDVISYLEMCTVEGTSLQRGMNYHLNPTYSVFLMSVRPGSPYNDRVEDDGQSLVYEGHDVTKRKSGIDPKSVDQMMLYPSGTLTQNGLFYEAATNFKEGRRSAEQIRVYEKIREGIWVYNGLFNLVDAWQELSEGRLVFKFKLSLVDDLGKMSLQLPNLDHSRFIPSSVKLEVWKRDSGQCVKCGSNKNLHFDHIIPFSKGGTSLKSENIQLLCAVHNLSKHDKIE